jgi:hypothetical protein
MQKPTKHLTNKLNCKHLHDVEQLQLEGTFESQHFQPRLHILVVSDDK